MVEILITHHYSPAEIVKSRQSKGRHHGKPVGSYIIDLVDLKKAIILCPSCVKGFNPKAHHYVRWNHRRVDFVNGSCDACREHFPKAFMFVHESTSY